MLKASPSSIEKLLKRKLGPLASQAVKYEYAPEEVIFEEGTASDGLYLVTEGEVAFKKRTEGGEFRTVSYSRAGDFFGEIGVLTGHARSLHAFSQGHTAIVKIPAESLVEYLDEMPGPINNLLQSIIQHLHETTEHYMKDIVRQEKMAVVGAMMNSIVHDFKNPFCLISLSAQLIEQMHTDEKTQRFCRNITEQVNRMLAMAQELAEYSRGHQTLRLTRLNLREVAHHFEVLNSPYFEKSNIAIVMNVPDLIIEGESGKLQRVLQNLIGNAIDAIGSNEGRIEVTAKQDGDWALLTISDNGPGIPEEIRNHMWEPFVTQGKSNGTGLGTAICRAIVEAHGGVISYTTETGKGTTFYIRLPRAGKKGS